jgi:hypothetical protein
VFLFKESNRPFFPSDAKFSGFSNMPGAIVADKTTFIPILEARPFRYMFLCPRRWGKSTFLNMLATYYDIKAKDSFQDVFGKLYIGSAPTESCNSHLILLFDFSSITSTGSPQEMKQSAFDCISRSLRKFLVKYGDLLGVRSPEDFIFPGRIAASLGSVLVSRPELAFLSHPEPITGSHSTTRLHRFRWCR